MTEKPFEELKGTRETSIERGLTRKQEIASFLHREEDYRNLFKAPERCVITLGDLFDAVSENGEVSRQISAIFSKPEPLTILVEGSAYEKNIDVLDRMLSARSNPQDSLVFIDISSKAVHEHAEHIQEKFPHKKYSVAQGDMNKLRLPNDSVDLVINDCTINFNQTDGENRKTVEEIRRVLKRENSAALLSAAVNKDFDSSKYGKDQERTPKEEISKPGVFHQFKIEGGKVKLLDITRLCWPVPYYKSLIEDFGFDFIEFDELKGKTFFPQESKISYRRFLLTPQSE